jgi:hypothetical protein
MALGVLPMFAFEGLRGVSQAATGSLAAAVWQGALLAGAAGLGVRLLPKAPASVRFAIWFAVFVAVAALPVVPLLVYGWSRGVGAGAAHPVLIILNERWCVAVLGLWAVASIFRAGTLVVAAMRVRALWRRSEPVTVVGMGAGLVRRAQVCVSDEIDRPSVIGFFAPKILIPRWLLGRLTEGELEQIVLHEGTHLRRADDWLNLAQKLALVVFPLNPALLWVERRLCLERELACDEQVLRATGAPKAYAACLASLAEHRMGRARGLALALGALGRDSEEPRSELGRRVQRILSFSERMSAGRARLAMAAAGLAVVLVAGELARCPQLVGFAPAEPATATLIAPAQFHAAHRGYAAENVVFHAAPVRLNAGTDGKPGKQTKAIHAVGLQERQNVPHEILLNAFSPGSLRRPAHPVRGWVVVTTSWIGADGSRLVLTTAHAADGYIAAAYQPRGESDAGDDALQSAQRQVYPYAAVPVRGGWLVFQL